MGLATRISNILTTYNITNLSAHLQAFIKIKSEMTQKKLLKLTANLYCIKGLCVIPVNESKVPIGKWKEIQAPIDPIKQWGFRQTSFYGIGMLTGKRSGKVEGIDIDCKYDLTGTLFEDYCKSIEVVDPGLTKKLVIQKTLNGGYHFLYKCETVAGNQKLASRPATEEEKLKKEKVKVLIETRGEGGYIMCAPSSGYNVTQGSIENIGTITPDEREILFKCARGFNQMVEPIPETRTPKNNSDFLGLLSPFEDFNNRGDILQYLSEAGWIEEERRQKSIMLLRPGGKGKWSADYHLEQKLLYVFSSSTEFDADKGYNHSQVLAHLKFNKDFSATAKFLIANGFGKKNKPDEIVFWYIRTTEKKGNMTNTLHIDQRKFALFLQSKGFFRIYIGKNPMYIRIENNIVDEVTNNNIRDYVKEYVRKMKWIITEEADPYTFYRTDLEDSLIKGNSIYFSESVLSWIEKTDLKIKRDNKDEAFYYFRNCFLKVTKDTIEDFSFSELKEPIWRKQIIDRDFKGKGNIKQNEGEFYRFVWNVCNKNNERFLALLSALGYLLHSFKDKSNAKMIAFVDEHIGNRGEANGGSGKSLVSECIRKFKNVCYKGKGWSPVQSFAFENISLATDILLIDDALQNFPFELLFTHITNDFLLEGKGDKSFVIPFDQSPKILLTTNYSLRGEGGSYDRRKSVNEFSSYYGSEITPISEFGHRLFDDWDDLQWQSFDLFMLYAVQHFLTQGLQAVNINYAERELRELVPDTFIDLMDELKNGENHLSNDLLKNFMDDDPAYKIKQNTFNSWIKKYIKVRKILTEGNQDKINKFSPFTKVSGKQFLKLINR